MPNSANQSVRVLRYRVLIEHIDPLTRQMCVEVTIHNDLDETVDEVILKEDTYRPGLRVLDRDDSQLALLPNEMIREILTESGRPEDLELVKLMNAHQVYVYWIKFPQDSALQPRDTRVIRLVHTEGVLHDYRASSLSKIFFNIPEYEVEVNVPETADYPHFISVLPPPDHRLVVEDLVAEAKGSTSTRNLSPEDHFYVGASGPCIDVAIPHLKSRIAQVRLVYGVYPERNQQHLLIGIILGLVLISAGFLATMLLFWRESSVFGTGFLLTTVSTLNSNALLLGSSLALLSAGFVGLAEGSVFQRTKWWACGSGAMAALGMFFALLH